MSTAILFNILFVMVLVALVVVLWLILGRRGKKQLDENATVAGRFQSGLAHRMNTPEIRK